MYAVASRRLPAVLVGLVRLVGLAVLLTACTRVEDTSAAIVVGGDDDGFHGALLTEPYVVPAQPLTDTDGMKYSLAKDTATPLTLVFFGYTHCPDVCQIVMSTITSGLTRLEADQREQVEVVFVTTDPARDDASTLRAYLDQFDDGFTGLTGDLDTIVAVAEDLGVYVAHGEKLPDGGYEVDHSTPVIGVADDGQAPIVWTQGTSSEEFADDITRLLTEMPSAGSAGSAGE